MNKRDRYKKASARRSQLSRQLLLQYFLALVGYIAALVLFVFLSWQVCSMITWSDTNPLYWILQVVKGNILVFISIFALAGWTVITYRFISKPLRYLDEVVAAAEQLAIDTEKPVQLSDAMFDTQNELNLVRETALRDANAAKEAEQRKNDLIIYLAHDLKTPLTSVIGYLTLLRDEPDISQELRAKYTGIALDKAERLEDLINEFFDITRFNLTALTLDEETVNLTLMLEQIMYEFNPVLMEKDLTWNAELIQDVHIHCDPNKLKRVFDNLFRNAVNYSYNGTSISVSLVIENNFTVIQVKNHGKTIPPEKLSHIFEQFFRLDSSRASATGGAGLGLAIAKEIVDLHGGTITAESVDEIISFTVRLPKARQKFV